MRHIITMLIAGLLLAACGAGYNPGCDGLEGKTDWCRYHPP